MRPAAGRPPTTGMSAQTEIVFLVDDDPAVLEGLQRLLRGAGFTAQGYLSPERFLEHHDPQVPGCAVLDLSMGGDVNGLELQRILAARGDDRPVIFLTGQGDIPDSVRAMKAGAIDFLTKPVDGEVLLDAIRNALEQDRRRRETRDMNSDAEQRLGTLTERELEVLRHVIAGRLNKQIAAALGVAEKTVKVHRGRVMAKMGVRSVAELVRVTAQIGIVPLGGDLHSK
jgi:FixJ family two-component response regulator